MRGNPSLYGISVVVVDDNDTTRAMLRGILRQEGAEVVGEAKDGLTALAICRKLTPRLVCLDVMMPGVSGVDVLRDIRTEMPETRVLMVTGSTERQVVQASIEGGASGYVVKPFNAARVIAAVQQAFSRAPAPVQPASAAASAATEASPAAEDEAAEDSAAGDTASS
ncbi:response regulator transcription factor [Uliginosibacterium sediminicola]|uniref:Response regulator transcription factor n=1 Tax=Uliginosibacterium sediminicola TaxID=2024550 RepID=A0ABU9YZA7_9RHOO